MTMSSEQTPLRDADSDDEPEEEASPAEPGHNDQLPVRVVSDVRVDEQETVSLKVLFISGGRCLTSRWTSTALINPLGLDQDGSPFRWSSMEVWKKFWDIYQGLRGPYRRPSETEAGGDVDLGGGSKKRKLPNAFVVEKVHRFRAETSTFKVQWVGYKKPTFEPPSSLVAGADTYSWGSKTEWREFCKQGPKHLKPLLHNNSEHGAAAGGQESRRGSPAGVGSAAAEVPHAGSKRSRAAAAMSTPSASDREDSSSQTEGGATTRRQLHQSQPASKRPKSAPMSAPQLLQRQRLAGPGTTAPKATHKAPAAQSPMTDQEEGGGRPKALHQRAANGGSAAKGEQHPTSNGRGAAVAHAIGAAGRQSQAPEQRDQQERPNSQLEEPPQDQQDGQAELQSVIQAAVSEITGCDAATRTELTEQLMQQLSSIALPTDSTQLEAVVRTAAQAAKAVLEANRAAAQQVAGTQVPQVEPPVVQAALPPSSSSPAPASQQQQGPDNSQDATQQPAGAATDQPQAVLDLRGADMEGEGASQHRPASSPEPIVLLPPSGEKAGGAQEVQQQDDSRGQPDIPPAEQAQPPACGPQPANAEVSQVDRGQALADAVAAAVQAAGIAAMALKHVAGAGSRHPPLLPAPSPRQPMAGTRASGEASMPKSKKKDKGSMQQLRQGKPDPGSRGRAQGKGDQGKNMKPHAGTKVQASDAREAKAAGNAPAPEPKKAHERPRRASSRPEQDPGTQRVVLQLGDPSSSEEVDGGVSDNEVQSSSAAEPHPPSSSTSPSSSSSSEESRPQQQQQHKSQTGRATRPAATAGVARATAAAAGRALPPLSISKAAATKGLKSAADKKGGSGNNGVGGSQRAATPADPEEPPGKKARTGSATAAAATQAAAPGTGAAGAAKDAQGTGSQAVTRAGARASLNATSRPAILPLRNNSGGGAEGGAVGDLEADACQNLLLLAGAGDTASQRLLLSSPELLHRAVEQRYKQMRSASLDGPQEIEEEGAGGSKQGSLVNIFGLKPMPKKATNQQLRDRIALMERLAAEREAAAIAAQEAGALLGPTALGLRCTGQSLQEEVRAREEAEALAYQIRRERLVSEVARLGGTASGLVGAAGQPPDTAATAGQQGCTPTSPDAALLLTASTTRQQGSGPPKDGQQQGHSASVQEPLALQAAQLAGVGAADASTQQAPQAPQTRGSPPTTPPDAQLDGQPQDAGMPPGTTDHVEEATNQPQQQAEANPVAQVEAGAAGAQDPSPTAGHSGQDFPQEGHDQHADEGGQAHARGSGQQGGQQQQQQQQEAGREEGGGPQLALEDALSGPAGLAGLAAAVRAAVPPPQVVAMEEDEEGPLPSDPEALTARLLSRRQQVVGLQAALAAAQIHVTQLRSTDARRKQNAARLLGAMDAIQRALVAYVFDDIGPPPPLPPLPTLLALAAAQGSPAQATANLVAALTEAQKCHRAALTSMLGVGDLDAPGAGAAALFAGVRLGAALGPAGLAPAALGQQPQPPAPPPPLHLLMPFRPSNGAAPGVAPPASPNVGQPEPGAAGPSGLGAVGHAPGGSTGGTGTSVQALLGPILGQILGGGRASSSGAGAPAGSNGGAGKPKRGRPSRSKAAMASRTAAKAAAIAVAGSGAGAGASVGSGAPAAVPPGRGSGSQAARGGPATGRRPKRKSLGSVTTETDVGEEEGQPWSVDDEETEDEMPITSGDDFSRELNLNALPRLTLPPAPPAPLAASTLAALAPFSPTLQARLAQAIANNGLAQGTDGMPGEQDSAYAAAAAALGGLQPSDFFASPRATGGLPFSPQVHQIGNGTPRTTAAAAAAAAAALGQLPLQRDRSGFTGLLGGLLSGPSRTFSASAAEFEADAAALAAALAAEIAGGAPFGPTSPTNTVVESARLRSLLQSGLERHQQREHEQGPEDDPQHQQQEALGPTAGGPTADRPAGFICGTGVPTGSSNLLTAGASCNSAPASSPSLLYHAHARAPLGDVSNANAVGSTPVRHPPTSQQQELSPIQLIPPTRARSYDAAPTPELYQGTLVGLQAAQARATHAAADPQQPAGAAPSLATLIDAPAATVPAPDVLGTSDPVPHSTQGTAAGNLMTLLATQPAPEAAMAETATTEAAMEEATVAQAPVAEDPAVASSLEAPAPPASLIAEGAAPEPQDVSSSHFEDPSPATAAPVPGDTMMTPALPVGKDTPIPSRHSPSPVHHAPQPTSQQEQQHRDSTPQEEVPSQAAQPLAGVSAGHAQLQHPPGGHDAADASAMVTEDYDEGEEDVPDQGVPDQGAPAVGAELEQQSEAHELQQEQQHQSPGRYDSVEAGHQQEEQQVETSALALPQQQQQQQQQEEHPLAEPPQAQPTGSEELLCAEEACDHEVDADAAVPGSEQLQAEVAPVSQHAAGSTGMAALAGEAAQPQEAAGGQVSPMAAYTGAASSAAVTDVVSPDTQVETDGAGGADEAAEAGNQMEVDAAGNEDVDAEEVAADEDNEWALLIDDELLE